MTDLDLTACRVAAEEAARAGAEQLEHWRGKFTAKEKGRADMVTEADLAAQVAVKAILLKQFPDHEFIGEEDGKKTGLRPPPGSPPCWVVDPLDGTSNYVHDVPAYCVSIGLWADGQLQVGVILDPRLNELFSGAKGHGAALNGKPMRVSPVDHLKDAMLSTGFPPAPDAQMRNLDAWRPLSLNCQAMRRTGSTALNLAYVAAGRFDGYYAFDNYPWDVAAGLLLVQEAGGKTTGVMGGPLDPFAHDVLATNGLIHAEMLGYLVK